MLHDEMGADTVLHLLSQLLWSVLIISAPILLLTLVVGLLVSIFQVVTQIQDMSLTFIPKLVAAVLALLICGSWMLGKLSFFARDLISRIPELIG